jgi:hypothetical protein
MNCNSFRRRIGDVYIVANFNDITHSWDVEVTDAASRGVDDSARRVALAAVMNELSSLRQHIWHEELGNARD